MEAWRYGFMQQALIAAVLASVVCGVMGTLIVLKRVASLTGGLAHSAFGGIGLALYLQWPVFPVLIPVVILNAIIIGWIRYHSNLHEDTIVGIFWSLGMAIGILLVSALPGYTPDLFSYLFGNILTVPAAELSLIAILTSLVVLAVLLFFKEFVSLIFDEEYAASQGVPVFPLYLLFLSLIALTIIILLKVVGIILLIALLTIPPSISRLWLNDLKGIMLSSVLLGLAFNIAGLWLSYYLNAPSGATIIVIAALAYFISLALSGLFKRQRFTVADS